MRLQVGLPSMPMTTRRVLSGSRSVSYTLACSLALQYLHPGTKISDDHPQSVEWFQVRHIYTSMQSGTTISVNICSLVLKYLVGQNVCRNTTVVAVSTQENGGNFATPKHAAPPVVVSSLDAFFTLSGPEAV